jgi:type II secretory pathway pseudopilin PulG
MKNPIQVPGRKPEQGFSLVEVLIAMVILMIGLLALLGLFTQAVSSVQYAQEDLIAKQKAREILESIYAARNDSAFSFDCTGAPLCLQNVSNGGPFADGMQPMLDFKNGDGVAGTPDDGPGFDSYVLPGPNGILGDADDVTVQLSNYQRQIQISPLLDASGNVNPDLRQITVTVRVLTPSRGARDYQVGGYISRYR